MVQDFFINENIFLENSKVSKDLTVVGNISAVRSLVVGEGINTTLFVEDGIVGINTETPNEVFTVVGNISASGNIYGNFVVTGPAVDTGVRALSSNWQNSYTTVQNNSSFWERTKFLDIFTHSGSNFTALPEHSGRVVIIDTTSGPLTAFFNEPLPTGFNLGIIAGANNGVTLKSTNSTIKTQGGNTLFFDLDKALVLKDPSGSYIALGDLV
jgi:hypothetical protein